MPRIFVDPDQLLCYKGVTIFHTYRNNDGQYPLRFHYGTDVEENEKFTFDVRDLPNMDGYDVNQEESQKLIIKNAIDEHILLLPEGIEYNPDDMSDTTPERMLDRNFEIPLNLCRRDIAKIFGNGFALALEAIEIASIADRMAAGFQKPITWEPVLLEAMNLPDLLIKIEAWRNKSQ